MRIPSEKGAMRHVVDRLAVLAGVDPSEIRLRTDANADGIVEAGSFAFLVEWKGSGTVATVVAAIEQLSRYASEFGEDVIPLLAVPFMGASGRERCADADVAWMDLSGNARILAPRLRIVVDGQPNRYKRRGRPSTVFAPKSSRVARWLLMHPAQSFTQREVARATHMDEGYTSKVVGKLEDDGLIVRDDRGAIAPRDPDVLLDAWREAYDFSKHECVQGHVAARSGDGLLRELAGTLEKTSVAYAATGLGAAWLMDRFAGFRIVTLYLAEYPPPELRAAISFREDSRGANVWLVIPNDEGVFHGAELRDGVRCVHPVQAYLDLHGHPERADEAAQKLRTEHLNWRSDG